MSGPSRWPRWWEEKASYWGRVLDVLILLDASDDILLKRIRERSKRHFLEDYSDTQARSILKKDRRLNQSLIEELRKHKDIRLIRVDTSYKSLDQVADDAMIALGLSSTEGQNGATSPSLSPPPPTGQD